MRGRTRENARADHELHLHEGVCRKYNARASDNLSDMTFAVACVILQAPPPSFREDLGR